MKSGVKQHCLTPRSIDPLDPVLPRSVGRPCYGGPSLWGTFAMADPRYGGLRYGGPSLWRTGTPMTDVLLLPIT